uniref:FBD domain-containing protein n=1 Tax=Oryza meridionalis TaxID=40149 RepID=A0A0E0ECV0_9ORYZ
MAVLVPIDGDGDGEGEGGRAKVVADPAPAPVDIDGDRGALDVLAPAPMAMDLDRDRGRDRDGYGDGAALVASTSNGRGRGRGHLNDLPEDIHPRRHFAPPLGHPRRRQDQLAVPPLAPRLEMGVRPLLASLPAPRLQHRARRPRRRRRARGHQHQQALRRLPPQRHAGRYRLLDPRRRAPHLRRACLLQQGLGSVPHALRRGIQRYNRRKRRARAPLLHESHQDSAAPGVSWPIAAAVGRLRRAQGAAPFVCPVPWRTHPGRTVMPFLEGLEIYCARGLASLTLRLKHLNWMNLSAVRGLLRLNAVVPRLKFLTVSCCFRSSPWLVAMAGVCIVAEELQVLKWLDWYCPRLIKFSQMPRLYVLSVSPFYPYGRHRQHTKFNPSCDRLLKTFSRIRCLEMLVFIEPHLGGVNPLMEGITRLPDIRFLHLQFSAHGHDQDVCPPNCSCDRPPNWRDNKDISMRSLREVQMLNFRGKEHELDLLRVLVRVARGIRRMRITCHRSFAAWERLSAVIRSFARPETSVEVSQAPPSMQRQ